MCRAVHRAENVQSSARGKGLRYRNRYPPQRHGHMDLLPPTPWHVDVHSMSVPCACVHYEVYSMTIQHNFVPSSIVNIFLCMNLAMISGAARCASVGKMSLKNCVTSAPFQLHVTKRKLHQSSFGLFLQAYGPCLQTSHMWHTHTHTHTQSHTQTQTMDKS